jgi:hypothetical protein
MISMIKNLTIDKNIIDKAFNEIKKPSSKDQYYILEGKSQAEIDQKIKLIDDYYTEVMKNTNIFLPLEKHGKIILDNDAVKTDEYIKYRFFGEKKGKTKTDTIEFYEYHIANYPTDICSK